MKLYITDLDGTFLDHKAEVPRLSEAVINREIKNGVNFTYATARSIYSAEPIMKEINITLPIITQNGTFIVDPITKKQLVTHYFSDKSRKFLIDFFDEHKEALLVYAYFDGEEHVSWLTSNTNKGVKRYIKDREGDRRLRPCDNYSSLFDGEIYYVTLIMPEMSKEELDKYFDNKNGFARNYQPDTYDTEEYWYEIYREDVSKANAVLELKKLLNADEIICFGDNVNDLSMFDVADRCYAVCNAVDELKAKATGIVRSNNQSGVPLFIAEENSTLWHYDKKPLYDTPDDELFADCIAKSETELSPEGIGTLNEKQIHSVLKSYFASSLFDKEIKIGNYYADLVTETGIVEIQTQNFKKLIPKLDVFLQASHVTVVYPFHKRTRLNYFDKKTGELIKSGNFVTHKDMTDFFLELYRIKQHLNNKNLTICIAKLEVENFRYTAKDMKRRKTDLKKTVPTKLSELIYLEEPESYRIFLPDGLPEIFTKKQFQKLCRISESSILIEILKYMGIIDFYGKRGNEYIYCIK